jgi:hypothetical protein
MILLPSLPSQGIFPTSGPRVVYTDHIVNCLKFLASFSFGKLNWILSQGKKESPMQ